MTRKLTNFLEETQRFIEKNELTHEDIIFIGSEVSGYSCDWNKFTQIANVEYYSGYGSQQIASDLIIVFKDGSKMWRSEYDGAEGWRIELPFVMPEEPLEMEYVCVTQPPHNDIGWCNLKDLHHPQGKYREEDY